MKKILKILLFTIVIFIIVFSFFIYLAQPAMLFKPWNDENSYNKLKKMTGLVEEINVKNSYGENLSGWIIYNNSQTEKSPTILYYQPNMGNSSNFVYSLIMGDKLKYFEGYNFITVDYPGYGLSEGKPKEGNVLDTGTALYDYAKSKECVDENNIVIMAYSIGTGVGTYTASNRDTNGLILIAPYDEFTSICNGILNIFYGPLKHLQRFKFESYKYAENIHDKPLIFTSTGDKLIKKEYTDRLIKHFKNEPKEIVFENIGHNDYWKEQKLFDEINKYLQEKL